MNVNDPTFGWMVLGALTVIGGMCAWIIANLHTTRQHQRDLDELGEWIADLCDRVDDYRAATKHPHAEYLNTQLIPRLDHYESLIRTADKRNQARHRVTDENVERLVNRTWALEQQVANQNPAAFIESLAKVLYPPTADQTPDQTADPNQMTLAWGENIPPGYDPAADPFADNVLERYDAIFGGAVPVPGVNTPGTAGAIYTDIETPDTYTDEP